jgi:hypothetical protein
VLRELRETLCQTLLAGDGSKRDIRNFCPKVVTLSTGFLAKSTKINELVAGFQQVRGAFALPATPIRHRQVNQFGHVDGAETATNENGAQKYVS